MDGFSIEAGKSLYPALFPENAREPFANAAGFPIFAGAVRKTGYGDKRISK